MRVFQLGDQREFFAQGGAQRVVDHAAEICVDAGPGQIFQMLLRGLARRHRLVRILVFQLIQRKNDAIGKAHGFRDRFAENRETAAPFHARASGDARHWPQAVCRRRRSWSSRGCRSAHPAADGARDGGTAPRWSRAAALLPPAPGDAAAPAGACRRRDRAGSPPATRRRRGCRAAAASTFMTPAVSKRCGSVRMRSWPSANSRRSSSLRWHSPFSIRSISSPRLPRVRSWHSRP